jgi:nucleotide-binding universal stress UspA family protein
MALQHFIVPLDFSAYSDRALDYAMGLAKQLQTRLTLLHVIYMPRLGEAELNSYIADLEAESRRPMEACLKRVQDAGLEGGMALVHGVPFREIIEVAKAKQADLIIMGTHGRTGLEHLIIGSVAERVIRLAPCPVLVTRGPNGAPKP